MKFLVITGAPILLKNNQYTAYPPYVREMNVWFDKVESVSIISPSSYPFSLNTKPFKRKDIDFIALPFLNFSKGKNVLKSILYIPGVLIKLISEMKKCDHLHLRCPGNISLIACLVQIFFPSKPKTVKYAGNWDPDSSQPWSYRLQKAILRNSILSRNISVLVYGKWEEESNNIIPFFTASFKESEKETLNKDFDQPLKFMFVGSLVAGKRPLAAIKLIEKLNANGVEVKLSLYGEGGLKKSLESYIKKKQLESTVNLSGHISLEELKQKYKKAHFVVLPSKSEGWPKALAEGMFFGCIPVATKVSCVPWMLKNGNRGILLNSNINERNEKDMTDDSLADDAYHQIISLSDNREEMLRMSKAAKEWSEEYTLDRFEAEIERLLLRPDR